jgi:hypothetical protein
MLALAGTGAKKIKDNKDELEQVRTGLEDRPLSHMSKTLTFDSEM